MFERIVPIDDTANGGYRVSRERAEAQPIYLYAAEARALAAALLAAAEAMEA